MCNTISSKTTLLLFYEPNQKQGQYSTQSSFHEFQAKSQRSNNTTLARDIRLSSGRSGSETRSKRLDVPEFLLEMYLRLMDAAELMMRRSMNAASFILGRVQLEEKEEERCEKGLIFQHIYIL